MAIVQPFGDPNAHGSLADSLTFRRSKLGVILEKKPHPRPSNTPDQIVQRAAFASAQAAWWGYDFVSKPYFNLRGVQLNLTPRNLFSRAYLLGQLPTNERLACTQVVDVQLLEPAGYTNLNTVIAFASWDTVGQYWAGMGQLDIDTNIWTAQPDFGHWMSSLWISVWSTLVLPFRWGIYIKWKDLAGPVRECIFRTREGLPDQIYNDDYYLDADSTAWTSDLFAHWLTTNNF
jgi:hypothetical protein